MALKLYTPMLLAWLSLSLFNTQRQYIATAFTPSCDSLPRSGRLSPSLRQAAASAEDTAKAMTDYMAKSHEDKLKAIKQVEAQKAAEIEVRSVIIIIISSLCFLRVSHVS